MRKNKQWMLFGLCLLGCSFLLSGITWAQSSSPNYRLEESYFGTGGEVDASSSSYRARQSTGSLGVGNTSSTNFDVVAGATTPSEPFLEMAVNGVDVNFGFLDPVTYSFAASQGGACNCSFYVRSYLSSGYNVVTVSQTLTSENGDTIEAKSSTSAPTGSDSTEEFGINLVANTVPGAMGAVPVNEPDNSFADGRAYGDGPGGARDYDDANQYAYGPGDIIASSPATVGNQGVGKTNYTISYMAKAAQLSEAGNYRMDHTLVVVATF